LLLALLFWSIFLPLGARYSVDAALNGRRIESESVCSPASAALVVQVLSVYFFGALLKTGDAWVLNGEAVHAALHFSAYASQLGVWMGEVLPPVVQRWLTWFTYYIELYGPILVLLPFFTAKIRLVIVPLLMLMHVGFALLLTVGIYPYLSITSLLLLVPSRFWEVLRAKLSTPERDGLKIYFDAPCTFCKKVCLLLRTFLLLDATPVGPAQDQPHIQKLLEEHNSWVVEDFDGQRYVRWAAMIIVFRRSWLLSPVAGVFAMAPLRALGERFYSWVADNREKLGRLTSVLLPYRSFDTRLPLLVHLAVAGLMLIVLYANAARVTRLELEFPYTFQRLTGALLLRQNWTMFAPEPGRATRWLFVEGMLESGGSVDVYNDSFTPPFLDKPLDGSGHFHGYRWRKYFNAANVPRHWPGLSAYYCRRWNERHPQAPVGHVLGYLLTERTRVGIYPGERQWVRNLTQLGSVPCN
jgi:predicted DCC family thiol-disulfide oxidoreductase YuxK